RPRENRLGLKSPWADWQSPRWRRCRKRPNQRMLCTRSAAKLFSSCPVPPSAREIILGGDAAVAVRLAGQRVRSAHPALTRPLTRRWLTYAIHEGGLRELSAACECLVRED